MSKFDLRGMYGRARPTGAVPRPPAPFDRNGSLVNNDSQTNKPLAELPCSGKGAVVYKNIDKQVKLQLKDQVDYRPGQVISKTLVQNDTVSMTVFSFDKGEEISTHAAAGDAMVTVLEGTGRFTVAGEVFILNAGETLIMPKDIPHAVFGEEQFKMVLVVSY